MTAASIGSPGGHPHADQANWQPAETLGDYLRNCQEGLEAYSDRRVATLLGWSRAKLYRVKQANRIPEALFEFLIAQDAIPSWKELAEIGRALHGEGGPEVERCPHCGDVIRERARWSTPANDWRLGKQSKMRMQALLAAICKKKPDTTFSWHWQQPEEYHVPVSDPCFSDVVDFLKNFEELLDTA